MNTISKVESCDLGLKKINNFSAVHDSHFPDSALKERAQDWVHCIGHQMLMNFAYRHLILGSIL